MKATNETLVRKTERIKVYTITQTETITETKTIFKPPSPKKNWIKWLKISISLILGIISKKLTG